MTAFLITLPGLVFLDSLNVLNIGVVSAIIYDARLNRTTPIRGALSFIAGVFTVTTVFGIFTVLGLNLLTDIAHFTITPAMRYWGELVLGVALIALAYFPLTAQTAAPGWALAATRRYPWTLGIVGVAVGLGQAPTAVPYLTSLAMLAALHPRPALWPLIVAAYCAISCWPLLALLGLSMRDTLRARQLQRRLVRTLTRYGPMLVRIMFLVAGAGMVVNATFHYRTLAWAPRAREGLGHLAIPCPPVGITDEPRAAVEQSSERCPLRRCA